MTLLKHPHLARKHKFGIISGIFVTLFGTAALLKSRTAQSEAGLVKLTAAVPERVADRVVAALTGLPATPEERKQFASGQITMAQLAEKYRNTDDFVQRYSQYWTQVLRIIQPVLFEEIDQNLVVGKRAPRVSDSLAQKDGFMHNTRILIFRKRPECSKPRYELMASSQKFQADVDLKTSQYAAAIGDANKATALSALNTVIAYKALTEKFRLAPTTGSPGNLGNDCACGTEVAVTPWWNTQVTVDVCPAVLTPRLLDASLNNLPGVKVQPCGPDLSKCSVADARFQKSGILPGIAFDPSHTIYDQLGTGFTLEPGMLIAKTVQDNRDYRTILTTTETTLNGGMEAFLANPNFGGHIILGQMPGGYNGKSTLRTNEGGRESFRWVERGAGNAGVLTTPAFVMTTNGYRAKANLAYQSFLCNEFVIPEGVKDTEPNITDLTVRQPCASCHVQLEPLGKLFAKWPMEGMRFSYNLNAPSQGGFKYLPSGDLIEGDDTQTVGAAFTKDIRFATCAVQRSYEFLLGRPPNSHEMANIVPSQVKRLQESNFKVWTTMLDIIQSDAFSGGSK